MAVGFGDKMVTDQEPISAQAGSPLSPLVGSLVLLKALGSLAPAFPVHYVER
jgi:hypothetical protein